MGRSTAALMSFGVIPGAVAVYAGQLVAIEQREGTGHVIFEPLDFSARLAGLVPSPAVNLTRYHGVFAPNHRLTALIVPAQRGRDGSSGQGQGRAGQCRSTSRCTGRSGLKRVFGIEINPCEHCGGAVKIIASIEDPEVIGRILEHLQRR